MKYVVQTLLFVNLLLQVTNSLRKCFNQDQNVMITIIVLAFTLIGIIGLTVGNRLVLLIFAACMTLILIASITIYAIGVTKRDAIKPRVPYYTTSPPAYNSNQPQVEPNIRQVGRIASPTKKQHETSRSKSRAHKGTKDHSNKTHINVSNSQHSMIVNPSSLEEFSDEPTNSKGSLVKILGVEKPLMINRQDKTIRSDVATTKLDPEDSSMEQQDSPDRVQSDQWIIYERLIYERYLEILSQSIDLIMHTILASWLALLLDDTSDQCFGFGFGASPVAKNGDPIHLRHSSSKAGARDSQAIYSYNGVRYSIRPDTADNYDDSPARIVVS